MGKSHPAILFLEIMNIDIKGFIIPHSGEPYYTCADRYAVDCEKMAIAIADGVGGSLYPSFLSERITRDFVKNPRSLFNDATHSLEKDYSSEFDSYYHHRYNESSPNKQEILNLKAEQIKASSCTFVGCYIDIDNDNKKWRYYALGDSYLFYIPKDGEMQKISSMDGKKFGVYPEYFSTSGEHYGTLKMGDIPLQEGVLLLMTDALSDWFIKYYKENKSLLKRILEFKTHKEYKEFCTNELGSGRLHDDDCTLIVIQISDAENPEMKFSVEYADNITNLSEEELRKLLDQEKEDHKKDNKEKDKEIEELKNRINSSTRGSKNDTLFDKLDEIKELLGGKFSEVKEMYKSLLTLQDSLESINKEIKERLQQPVEKEEVANLNAGSGAIVEDDSKKKLINLVTRNANLIFNIIIILLQLLILLLK